MTADSSFMVSLFGSDTNTPTAREWAARHDEPILVTDALRFETENALRLCRAYDITHVAAALLLKVTTFLSFDKKQRVLATSVGLIVAP